MTSLCGKSLTNEISALNDEILQFYKKCQKAGFEDKKLKEITYPVTHIAKRVKWKHRAKQLIYFSIIVGMFAGIVQWDTSNRFISAVCKKFMVNHVLPRYDWTWIWNEECLMENPYYEAPDPSFQKSECDACSNFTAIRIVEDVNTSFVSKTIFEKEPIIVTDAMKDWPATTESLSLDDLSKLYRRNKNLKGYDMVCEMRLAKGMELHEATVQELFNHVYTAASEGKEGNFTAYWSNCHQKSSREIHKFYYQPYFLPGMCEPNKDENYVLTGRKSSTKSKALTFQIASTGYWIAQVHGKMEVLVKARKVCQNICKPITFFLEKGQILNIPSTRLYTIGFRPASVSAVALGVGYIYDN